MNPFESIFTNDYPSLVSYLEKENVNITDERGKSLLDYAIQFHNNDIFELLLKSYINVNIKDNVGNTAFHYAVINNRLGYLKTKTPEETEFVLREKLPIKHWIDINSLLVTHGQNVCKPIKPMCEVCPIKDYCEKNIK